METHTVVSMHGDALENDSTHGSVLPVDGQIAYSTHHAALVLDLSERKVQYLIQGGEIASFKEGRSRRISRRALEEYCKRREALEHRESSAA